MKLLIGFVIGFLVASTELLLTAYYLFGIRWIK